MPPRRPTLKPLAALAALGLSVAACSSTTSARAGSGPTTAVTTTAPAATTAPPLTTGTGPVNVLYAGSLVTLMDQHLGPAFEKATGYTFSGVSGDSGSLATEIKGRTQQGDIFISASPSKDQVLEGPDNGDWVSWYATFATSNLVLGYNPHSRFAAALRSQPWYQVVTRPGFLLGRTDPATDPKGKLTATALQDAASTDGASTASLLASASNVFPENTLVGRLQSGQLDAGFFYAVEAASAGLPTVALAGVAPLKATYTVTVLNQAPHASAAQAFLRFLLGADGTALLGAQGLTVTRPAAVTGTPPASLQALLSGA